MTVDGKKEDLVCLQIMMFEAKLPCIKSDNNTKNQDCIYFVFFVDKELNVMILLCGEGFRV